MTAADQLADDAMARLRDYIARSAGQHHRAIAKGFAQARAAIAKATKCPGAAGGCNVPEGECIGACQP